MGGIFSNNVLLGIPLAKVTLGEASLPAVSLVLVFNSLVLWTLVTVSVEWARHRDLSPRGLVRTTRGVVANPVVAQHPGRHRVRLLWACRCPDVIDQTLLMVSQAAVPLSLIALGMGLAEFGIRARMARERRDRDAQARGATGGRLRRSRARSRCRRSRPPRS